ncbi:hypothetical protein PO909_029629, partial [Leuciscus waleckii]
ISKLRIERLWQDVWTAVTNVFYHALHTLENEGYLDLSSTTHIFACHYVFLPRLQNNLDNFREGWDNHPIQTEQNLTPNQLWDVGQMQNPIADPDNAEVPVIDWEEDISRQDNGHTGVTVPILQSPLNPEQMEQLRSAIDPMGPSDSLGMDIYISTVQFVESLIEMVDG